MLVDSYFDFVTHWSLVIGDWGLGNRLVAGKGESYPVRLRSTASAIALRKLTLRISDLVLLSSPIAAFERLSDLLGCRSLGMLVSRSLGIGH